jgi:hypothetical protein
MHRINTGGGDQWDQNWNNQNNRSGRMQKKAHNQKEKVQDQQNGPLLGGD